MGGDIFVKQKTDVTIEKAGWSKKLPIKFTLNFCIYTLCNVQSTSCHRVMFSRDESKPFS